MQATITYLLTEETQRAQMAATDQPVARKQMAVIDVPTEDLIYYPILADGTINIDLTGNRSDELRHACKHYASVPDIPAFVRGQNAQKTRVAELISSADEAMAGDVDAMVASGNVYSQIEAIIRGAIRTRIKEFEVYGDGAVPSEINPLYSKYPSSYFAEHAPLTVAAAKRFSLREAAANDARSKREAESAALKKNEELAREKAKEQFISDWIAEHADGAIRQQYSDNLLCRAVAIDLIADSFFDACNVPAESDCSGETCDSRDCPCTNKLITCLPIEIYPAWKAIKSTLPDGYSVEFRKVRECLGQDPDVSLAISLELVEQEHGEEETAGPTMYLATLKLPCGPFVFERTVRLG